MGLGTGLHRCLSGYSRYGQNGALGRLHDCLVGRLNALGKRTGQIHAIGSILPLHILGEAPEQQGCNNAGVAPGAPQQCCRSGIGYLADRNLFPQLGKLLGSIAQSQGHVGTGIAIGHRENVQIVDNGFIVVNISGRTDKHLSQLSTADQFFQVCCTSGMGLAHRNHRHSAQSTLMESI